MTDRILIGEFGEKGRSKSCEPWGSPALTCFVVRSEDRDFCVVGDHCCGDERGDGVCWSNICVDGSKNSGVTSLEVLSLKSWDMDMACDFFLTSGEGDFCRWLWLYVDCWFPVAVDGLNVLFKNARCH